jgi:hypothetical protein
MMSSTCEARVRSDGACAVYARGQNEGVVAGDEDDDHGIVPVAINQAGRPSKRKKKNAVARRGGGGG